MDYPDEFIADFHKESWLQLIKLHQTIEKDGKLWKSFSAKPKQKKFYGSVLLITTHAKILTKMFKNEL